MDIGIVTEMNTAYFRFTCPRAVRDLFIAAASTNVCPVAPVLAILSDPAKSTSVSEPYDVALETLLIPSTNNMRSR